MGTNFIFGTISFITNSIAIVLQLAMAIDYAIIFCHRYMEERDNGLDAREADIAALSKAIIEINWPDCGPGVWSGPAFVSTTPGTPGNSLLIFPPTIFG